MGKEARRVNMLATARDAQWSMQTFLGSDAVKLVAPAKVNLFLDVGARRENGYHDVTTVLHTLALHDVMYMRALSAAGGETAGEMQSQYVYDAARSGLPDTFDWDQEDELPDYCVIGGPAHNLEISIECIDKTGGFDVLVDELDIPAQDNIVFKAIEAYAAALDYTQPARISIRLEKNIPHEAGLGGGSSDAAAALLAMAHFWDKDVQGLPDQTLLEVAHSLGSDVPFFLQGGCALYTGTGVVLDHVLVPRKDALVIVKPTEGVSTAAAYRVFDEMSAAGLDERDGQDAQIKRGVQGAQDVRNAQNARDVPLYNNLVWAAERLVPAVGDVRSWLGEQDGINGQDDVTMSGSGSALFAVTESFAQASSIAAKAQLQGWWARATTFSSLRSALLP